MSQWFLSYRVLLFLFHFCVFLLQLSELVWKLAEGISLQSASKRLPSFGPSSNGNKSNAINTRICPNWNLTGTIYHWSLILRSFSVVSNSAKRDANGFFKLLLLSSHLLISGHPVRKSKFGACAVTGYCSFNPLTQGNFAKKLVLKLVELFSDHCLAIKSQVLPKNCFEAVYFVCTL